MGSPDPNGRQLDGMGGGISSLSKICVVKDSERDDASVDFTFVQVGIREGMVDYEGNCGNMTAAIGPFAVDSGLVDSVAVSASASKSGVVEATTEEDDDDGTRLQTIKLYNTNTDKIIQATFPVNGEEAVATGSFSIDGVAGSGAEIRLDFIDPAGSKTGSLLPTGNIVDKFFDGKVRATCIDVGNPCIFVPASEVLTTSISGINDTTKLKGIILPDEMQNHPTLLTNLESIRQEASIKMGFNNVPPSIPKICLVSCPTSHRLSSGDWLDGCSVDVVVRAISTQQPHKALPITSGLAVSAAATMSGTVVAECLASDSASSSAHDRGRDDDDGAVVIGHPSGTLKVNAVYDARGGLEKATVYRTARRLMDGNVYWKG